VPLRNGTKVPQAGETGHTDTDNHRRPTVIDGNCSLHTGHNLLAIDIDDHDAFPGKVKSLLPDTLTITSPHGGEHLLYHVPDDTGITNAGLPNGSGEIRYDGYYVVCPGSYLDHSNCDSDKSNCPGNGTDQYQPANDLPIATLTESEHADLLSWMRNPGCEQSTTSESGSATYRRDQELDPLNETNAEVQKLWFYQLLHQEAGDAARQEIDNVLKGGDGGVIDSSSSTRGIDRNKADYYTLKRLYGAFLIKQDNKPSRARKNALDVLRFFIQEYPYHEDGQPRKLNDAPNRYGYINSIMDAVEDDFSTGDWFRWFNKQPDNDTGRYWQSDGPSRITKATVLAALESLYAITAGRQIPIKSLQLQYEADFEPIDYDEAIRELPTYPSTPHPNYLSVLTPLGSNTRSTDQPDQVRTSSVSECANGKAADRAYPTRSEIEQVACLLNPEREPATFGDALSNLVNDPDPLVTVVQAKCPSRSSGERYVYYLDQDSDGERDPTDAEYVKLHGRELEPTTRKPVGESTDSVQEMSI
jgi:hypothetical protein